MTMDEMLDLLRSLSIIEGAVCASGNRDVETVVTDQLEWCVDLLRKKLKDEKC